MSKPTSAVLESITSADIKFDESTPFAFRSLVEAYAKYKKGEHDIDDVMHIALAHDGGDFVPKSPEKCVDFLQVAAEMGDGEAYLFIAERMSGFTHRPNKNGDLPLFDPESAYAERWLSASKKAWDIFAKKEEATEGLVKAAVLYCTIAGASDDDRLGDLAYSVMMETRGRIGDMMKVPGTPSFETASEWLEWLDNVPNLIDKLQSNLLLPEFFEDSEPSKKNSVMPTSGIVVMLETPNPDDYLDMEMERLISRYARLSHRVPLAPVPDPDFIEGLLRKEFPWMEEAIQAVVRQIALAKYSGNEGVTLPPLILYGASGVGKTRFASRVAEVLGVPSRTFSAAGNGDARPLVGTSKGWSNAQPSSILTSILYGNRANPVMIIDELDKEGHESGGSISQALHTLLEPRSSATWVDECFGISCNLSRVSWIIICNDKSLLPNTITNRCECINVPKPDAKHANTIINGVLLDIASRNGKTVNDFPELTDEDRRRILKTDLALNSLDAREIRMKTERLLADKSRILLRNGTKNERAGNQGENVLSFSGKGANVIDIGRA